MIYSIVDLQPSGIAIEMNVYTLNHAGPNIGVASDGDSIVLPSQELQRTLGLSSEGIIHNYNLVSF